MAKRSMGVVEAWWRTYADRENGIGTRLDAARRLVAHLEEGGDFPSAMEKGGPSTLVALRAFAGPSLFARGAS